MSWTRPLELFIEAAFVVWLIDFIRKPVPERYREDASRPSRKLSAVPVSVAEQAEITLIKDTLGAFARREVSEKHRAEAIEKIAL